MTININTGKQITLSAAAERMNLAMHGTKAFPELTARNILQAAEKDVRYAAINKERRRWNAGLEPHEKHMRETQLPYSFPSSLASSATSAAALLEAVIASKPVPKTAQEILLYGDLEKVREALSLA